jgi:hypothetical protein
MLRSSTVWQFVELAKAIEWNLKRVQRSTREDRAIVYEARP